MFLMLAAAAAFAQNDASGTEPTTKQSSTAVRWSDVVGVITAQNVNNPVSSKIDSGTFAWSTTGGNATVDLATGFASFDVQGLVINGTKFSGTPGPITQVTGTLVCNPGDDALEMAFDTEAVPLSARGNAKFAGTMLHSFPAVCANPLFLIRIAVPTGAAGRWIATGVERRVGRNVHL
jgi:hypothetical protein